MLLGGHSAVASWLALRVGVVEYKLFAIANNGQKRLGGTLFFCCRLCYEVGFATIIFATLVSFDVESKIHCLAVLASKRLDAAFWNADGNVILAVFPRDFLCALQFEQVKTDVDGVVWHSLLFVHPLFKLPFAERKLLYPVTVAGELALFNIIDVFFDADFHLLLTDGDVLG